MGAWMVLAGMVIVVALGMAALLVPSRHDGGGTRNNALEERHDRGHDEWTGGFGGGSGGGGCGGGGCGGGGS